MTSIWGLRHSSSAKTILVSELISEFSSFWRRENAQSGVVYRTRTVLRILLELQIIHSLYFARRIILFWRSRHRACVHLNFPVISVFTSIYFGVKTDLTAESNTNALEPRILLLYIRFRLHMTKIIVLWSLRWCLLLRAPASSPLFLTQILIIVCHDDFEHAYVQRCHHKHGLMIVPEPFDFPRGRAI